MQTSGMSRAGGQVHSGEFGLEYGHIWIFAKQPFCIIPSLHGVTWLFNVNGSLITAYR